MGESKQTAAWSGKKDGSTLHAAQIHTMLLLLLLLLTHIYTRNACRTEQRKDLRELALEVEVDGVELGAERVLDALQPATQSIRGRGGGREGSEEFSEGVAYRMIQP